MPRHERDLVIADDAHPLFEPPPAPNSSANTPPASPDVSFSLRTSVALRD
jgi:hypothetical protein